MEKATEEVADFLADKKRGAKRGTKARLAAACGKAPPDFRHCLDPTRKEKFSVEDFGSIAEEAGAPPGWPWISWDDGLMLQALQFARLKNMP